MKTTFSRIFVPAAIALLVSLLVVGFSIQVLVKDYLQDQAMASLKSEATTISDLAAAYYTKDSLTSQEFFMNLSVASQVSGADAVICNARGELLLCSDAPLGCNHKGMILERAYLESVISSGCVTSTGSVSGLYDGARYVVSVPIYDAYSIPVGIVLVSSPMEAALRILSRIANIYLVVALLVVIVSVIVMSFLARKVSRPLKDMAIAASAFGHGQLKSRVQLDHSSPKEVQELTLAFNNMAASLERSESQRQEFVSNVSHELKTPMTTIGGYVDGMLDGTIPPENHRKYMQIVSDETKRLSRLVRSMLDISRLQNREIPDSKKSRFDICECIGQVLITFEQKIIQKNVNVQVQFPELPTFTLADEDAITQVVYNLVDNGVKFCPQDGNLGLLVRVDNRKIYVSVSNNGETIPLSDLPLVFDRFHKLDKSRSQNRDGWGLGLYIVKTIICSHGEDISVTSDKGETIFTFTLPLVN